MGLDSLNKDTSGASLVSSFKDIFPGKLEKLYIYRGTNLVSKGNEVFSREDTKTFIALELLKEVDIIYGGQAMTSTVRTITESKSIKETARQKVSTDSLTAFFRDLGDEVDLTEHNLYYTVKNPFIQGDLSQDQLEVLSDAQIVPNLLEKLISGASPISEVQKNTILNNKTASFTLSPAVLDNNLPASEVRFVDANIYKVLPTDEKDFEITSLDLESDQSLALEWRNGIKGRGIIENEIGQQYESDIDFKMDKPLLPLQIKPYSKFSNIQFEIMNFDYYQRMPYLSAKHFLGKDRSIVSFIKGSVTETWAEELATAVVDMFKMSWAISTGYSAYKTDDDSIGGVALKSMVGKDPDKLYPYVDQILRNWEYKNNLKNKNTVVYRRALQVLAASSEVVQSSYCIGKGLTEFHKTIFDYWLELNTVISNTTPDINMTLVSDKYVFTYEKDANGDDDFSKPIINLAPILDISKSYVTNFGRQVSLAELDDPIDLTGISSFAGDIDPTKADASKYFIGVDVVDPTKIAGLLVNSNVDDTETTTLNFEFDSSWYGGTAYNETRYGNKIRTGRLITGQQFRGSKVLDSGKEMSLGEYDPPKDPVPAPTLTDQERNDLITKELNLPKNAHNIVISFAATKEEAVETDAGAIHYSDKNFTRQKTNLVRFTGTVVKYDLVTTKHGVIGKQQNYGKVAFLNMILKFSDDVVWKRNLTLDESYRDADGKQISKIKSMNHIFISSFLGNYIDIKLNYKYTDDQGVVQTGTTLLPRIDLPAKDDERRTKLGIRL